MLLSAPGREILFIIVSFTIALLNISEVLLIVRCKNRKAFDKLLLSLAASDILVALSVASFKIADLITSDTVAWLDGKSFANIFLLSITFSVTNLIAITADRFLAVRFPIKYRIISTERRVNGVIVTIWSVGIVFVTLKSLTQFKWEYEIEFTLNVVSGLILLFGLAMVMAYIAIFYFVCKRTVPRRIGRGEESKGKNRSACTTERGIFLTGGIVSLSFIICTYPFAIDFLYKQSGEDISVLSRLFILLNSLLNPLIYFFKNYFTSRGSRSDTILG